MNLQTSPLVIVVAAFAGIAIALQTPLSSMIGRRLGPLESAFIVHLGGAILAGVFLIFAHGGGLGAWQQVPWYALSAGFLGVIIIGAINFTVPRIGAASTTTVIVVAQLAVSAAIDHFGWLGVEARPVTAARLGGIALLVVGAWLIVRD